MLQGEIPYREGLKLGIASTDTPFVLVVELRETGSHLSTARPRSRHDDQRTGGLHIVVLTKALVTGNKIHIVGITVDGIMEIRLDTLTLQTMTELIGGMLTIVVGDHHGAHHEVTAHKLVAKSQYILVVSDAQVCTYLVLLDVFSTDHNHDLDAVAQLCQHPEFRVRFETWQHA